ncbi:tRNA-queuosine alpha-mannosyltransferase domain-containing protein [Roseiconus lacunae]|uniref:tRNA-queuosine alpha-mannosyltransferase domain-containing protein n=1 Tax=Roseiconus lacunae TaxID=2605694 RepID=UPI0011F2C104|nr:DUF3524 domain-containing protein [Roseiconus lacunae]
MKVLGIEPYFGGSHRAFLEGLVQFSRHQWTLATLPARHWKWRMRSAPSVLADQVAGMFGPHVKDQVFPELVFCSDMLDLPTWIGFASRKRSLCEWIGHARLVTYFHENQWAYPTAAGARLDHHYGYTNLLTADLSDECWFNSAFNRDTFLTRSREFLRRMPDARDSVDLDRIERCSRIIRPGFKAFQSQRRHQERCNGLRVGWVGRFESDKRPDRFVVLLEDLEANGIRFELVLLGQRGRQRDAYEQIASRFSDQILFDGYCEEVTEYHARLAEIDVVVSTADHEFFGIAMCEAIWAGAVPVVPDGLCYPEYVPAALRYRTHAQAVEIIRSLESSQTRAKFSKQCRDQIQSWTIDQVAAEVDDQFRRLCQTEQQRR